MKLLSGTILLLAAEQAFAHSQLAQFPNQDDASAVLIPASVVFLILGSILLIWGLLSEVRGKSRIDAG